MKVDKYDIYFRVIPLFQNWSEKSFMAEESNKKRYKYYCAIASMKEGKEEKIFLKKSNDKDLYYNMKDVNIGDILMMSEWDSYKQRQLKWYGIVWKKDDKQMIIIDYWLCTSLRRTYKVKELLDSYNIEELYQQYLNEK